MVTAATPPGSSRGAGLLSRLMSLLVRALTAFVAPRRVAGISDVVTLLLFLWIPASFTRWFLAASTVGTAWPAAGPQVSAPQTMHPITAVFLFLTGFAVSVVMRYVARAQRG